MHRHESCQTVHSHIMFSTELFTYLIATLCQEGIVDFTHAWLPLESHS